MAPTREQELRERLEQVHTRIEDACRAAGRDRDEVTLIAVTKFFPAADVEMLADLGVRHVGESRDQEAGDKLDSLSPEVRSRLAVHFVGQVQRNKARRISGYADVVHSLDRTRLARALDSGRERACAEGEASGPLGVLIQVDLGEGEQAGRGGAAPAEVGPLADMVGQAEHLRLDGVMAIAPLGLDEVGARRAFERLVELGQRLVSGHGATPVISAGMSGDLEQAVAAGATHLRVGTAILGSRPGQR